VECPLLRRLVGVKRKCCKRNESDAPDPLDYRLACAPARKAYSYCPCWPSAHRLRLCRPTSPKVLMATAGCRPDLARSIPELVTPARQSSGAADRGAQRPIREAASASLKAPLRPAPVPIGPADASEEREASVRRRIPQYDSRRTNARPARSSRLSGGRSRRDVSMHVDLVKYHSSRCDRIRHTCEDATTIRPEPSIRHNLFRLARPLG
jgi:hypothetical protein